MLWTILWLGSNQAALALAPDAFNPDGSANQSAILGLFIVLSVLFSFVGG